MGCAKNGKALLRNLNGILCVGGAIRHVPDRI